MYQLRLTENGEIFFAKNIEMVSAKTIETMAFHGGLEEKNIESLAAA